MKMQDGWDGGAIRHPPSPGILRALCLCLARGSVCGGAWTSVPPCLPGSTEQDEPFWARGPGTVQGRIPHTVCHVASPCCHLSPTRDSGCGEWRSGWAKVQEQGGWSEAYGPKGTSQRFSPPTEVPQSVFSLSCDPQSQASLPWSLSPTEVMSWEDKSTRVQSCTASWGSQRTQTEGWRQ